MQQQQSTTIPQIAQQQNKQLKNKLYKLQRICQNLTKNNTNDCQLSYFSSIELKSPKSCLSMQYDKRELDNNINGRQVNTIQTLEYSKSPSMMKIINDSNNINNNNYQSSHNTIQQQINLHKSTSTLLTQLQQLQLQSISKSNKLRQLSLQLNRSKQQVMYLKKQLSLQKTNLKHYYQTIIVKQLQDKYQQDKIKLQNHYEYMISSQQKQIMVLKSTIDAMERRQQYMRNELRERQKKETKMVGIIKEMKLLLENNSTKHSQELTTLKEQISQYQHQQNYHFSQLTTYKDTLHLATIQNDTLRIQIKRLTKQLNTLKKQYQRSLSKSQRQLSRQVSMSKRVEKGYMMEKKLLEGELREKESKERYYTRQRKELIQRIRGLESGRGNIQGQFNSKNNNSSPLNSTNNKSNCSHMEHHITQSSFTKYFNHSHMSTNNNINNKSITKSNKSFQKNKSVTPKVNRVKTNNNGKGSNQMNSNKSSNLIHNSKQMHCYSRTECNSEQKNNNNNNKSLSSIHYSNNISRFKLQQTDNTNATSTKQYDDLQHHHHQWQLMNQTTPNINLSSYNNLNINTSLQLSPHQIRGVSSSKRASYDLGKFSSPQQMSNQINKQSEIKCRQQQQQSNIKCRYQQSGNMIERESFNQDIKELRLLEQYMRTSFNPNLILKQQQYYNNKTELKQYQRSSTIMNNNRIKNPQISQFQLISEESYHSQKNKLNNNNHCQLLLNPQQQEQKFINRLLKTEQSQQKHCHSNQQSPNSIQKRNNRPQQIEEVLNMTERSLNMTQRSIKQLSFKHISRKNSQQLFKEVEIKQNDKINKCNNNKDHTNSPMRSSTKLPLQKLTIQQPNDTFHHSQHKDLLKLTDLDTPCFESTLKLFSATNNGNQVNSTKQHSLALKRLPKQSQQLFATERQKSCLLLLAGKQISKKKRISISIANLNKTGVLLVKR